MSTARASDVWFSKCGRKVAVRALARSMNDGDGKRFLRKVDIETGMNNSIETFMTRSGNATRKAISLETIKTKMNLKTVLCKNQATSSLDISTSPPFSFSFSLYFNSCVHRVCGW